MTASQSAWMYQGVAVRSSAVLKEGAAWYCSASDEGATRETDRFHEPTVMSCSVPVCKSAMQNADIHPCRLFSNATKCQLYEISPFGPVFRPKPRALSRSICRTHECLNQADKDSSNAKKTV